MRCTGTCTLRLGLLLLLSSLTLVRADHSAPAPQLSGVKICLEPSSAQLKTEGVTQIPAQRVRVMVLDALRTQLESQGVPYASACATSSSYVLLSLYVRFLDPKTYIGFPKNSYTYVASAQIGGFVPEATAETVLSDSVYVASASDIFQANTPEALEQHLVMLGEAEAGALTQTWLEANTVTLKSYLLFAALGLLFALLRVLTLALP